MSGTRAFEPGKALHREPVRVRQRPRMFRDPLFIK